LRALADDLDIVFYTNVFCHCVQNGIDVGVPDLREMHDIFRPGSKYPSEAPDPVVSVYYKICDDTYRAKVRALKSKKDDFAEIQLKHRLGNPEPTDQKTLSVGYFKWELDVFNSTNANSARFGNLLVIAPSIQEIHDMLDTFGNFVSEYADDATKERIFGGVNIEVGAYVNTLKVRAITHHKKYVESVSKWFEDKRSKAPMKCPIQRLSFLVSFGRTETQGFKQRGISGSGGIDLDFTFGINDLDGHALSFLLLALTKNEFTDRKELNRLMERFDTLLEGARMESSASKDPAQNDDVSTSHVASDAAMKVVR